MMSFKTIPNFATFIRKYSVKIKPVITGDTEVLNNINNNLLKPRRHPGILQPKTVLIPDNIVKAVVNAIEDYPVKALLANGETLVRHLKGRVPPMEQEDIKDTAKKIHQRVLSKHKDYSINSEEDAKRFKQMVDNKVKNILREKVYNWKPVKYDAYNSVLYLMARFAPEYAVLAKIFGEISTRDPEFKPRGLFDFGSGVGTATCLSALMYIDNQVHGGTGAANLYWKRHIFEYYNVDASVEMNDLAEILLQGGKGTGNISLRGVFYRQFLPATKTTYDLVVSAYSLLELPSLETRLQTMLNLWNKTEKYLIIVEQGTNGGFKVINEIRDFILDIKKESNVGHIFSPCPHDDTCPRFLLDDGTPCNFEVNYFTLPIGQKSESKRELYSYIVLKKGKRSKNDLGWPRIVRPALVRSKHTICRICTAHGKLDEVIFTNAKHGKITYHCARASQWGDLLPVQLDSEGEKVQSDNSKNECNKCDV